MQPETTPLPVARVNVGMRVADASGRDVGRVAAVQMPGTDVRPEAVAGVAEHLMAAGYLRIDGTGFLSNDVYASGDQIGETVDDAEGSVTLLVGADELHRATD